MIRLPPLIHYCIILFIFGLWGWGCILLDATDSRSSKKRDDKKRDDTQPPDTHTPFSQPLKTCASPGSHPSQFDPSHPFSTLNPNIPLLAQIVQTDYLINPRDFEKSDDVTHLVKILNRPEFILNFYRTAGAVYADLSKFYEEVQGNSDVAHDFMVIVGELTNASLEAPLSVTDIVVAICRYLRPVFKTPSDPFDEMAFYFHKMNQSENRQWLGLMTRFFQSFTLREMNTVQDFIKMMSSAKLTSPPRKSETGPSSVKENSSSNYDFNSKKSKLKHLPKRRNQRPIVGEIDISMTGLESHSKRIHVVLANLLAKAIVLMQIFVTDPTAVPRTLNILCHLWETHLTRMAAREGFPEGEIDIIWKSHVLYRKLTLNFTFEDWSPDKITPEIISSLQSAAEEERIFRENRTAAYHKYMADIEREKFREKVKWTAITGISIGSLAAAVIYFYWRYRKAHSTKDDGDNNDGD